MYAEWDITTLVAYTVFGVAQFWMQLPESFPPIGFLLTTTGGTFDNEGLYIELYTTLPIAGTIACTPYYPQKVVAYMKGTRWFYTDAALGTGAIGSPTKAHLYYRAVQEGYNVVA
jgi:hypothetical protein